MLLFIHIIIPLIVSQKQEENKLGKRFRDVISLDTYDLTRLWRMAYRLGYIDGYESCEDGKPCSPRNCEFPDFFIENTSKEEDEN